MNKQEVLACESQAKELPVAEPLEEWRTWIAVFATIGDLWDLAGQTDALPTLRRLLDFGEMGVRLSPKALAGRFEGVEVFPLLTEWQLLGGSYDRPESGEVLRSVSRTVALLLLNRMLAIDTRPMLFSPQTRGNRTRDVQMRLVPQDLLGAVAILFANETMGLTRPPAICAGCGRTFVPSRKDAACCSDPCRVKKQRRTREVAANA